ncbi:MAG: thioredoxin family protein [Paludibacteraceae bacterium]|nr:thioredoxin family protein [Paludibacteraceae bacterium]
MKHRWLIGCLLGLALTVQADILTPVHWSGVPVSNNQVRLTARMDSSWHMTLISIGDSAIGEDYYDTYTCTVQSTDTIRYVACNDVQCLAPEMYCYHTFSHSEVSEHIADPDTSNSPSLWTIFLLGLLGGLLAIFTPCVWPVIPMTVSFFLHRGGGKRDAILYGLSIVIIYVGLGVLFTAIFGASALNELSTNAYLNLFFFVLFVVFSLSFFGLFEITLPASWATEIDRYSRQKSGWVSLLLMAFTLVIVSFSCTGPIIGTLLVEAASMNFLAPTIGMLGFALALAMPFSLLALFPDALHRLPKSGEWMSSLKVTLAFIELALSLKFLSVADTAYGWGILPRWLFFLLWVICFTGLAIYHIVGIVRLFRHNQTSPVRLTIKLAIVLCSLALSGYLLPAIWGATDAKLVAAFAPPKPIESKSVFHDFDEGMAYAKQENKRILVDFSGYGCVNCRKMEAYVLTDERVKEALTEYVFIELFVDSRQDENHNGILDGEEFSRLERDRFGSNAQPLYIKLNVNGQPIGTPMAYTTNPDLFLQWLQEN